MSIFFRLLIFCVHIWLCRYSQAARTATSTKSLAFLSAMCQSECLQKDEHSEIPSCIKPCFESKLHTAKNIKKCKRFCQENASVSGVTACAESCNFLLEKLLNGKTALSCSKDKACSSPVSPSTVNVTDTNATLSVLSWSSSGQAGWAVGTVFIVTARSRDSPDRQFRQWFHLDQTTKTSLALNMLKERTLWYQFQVVAVNNFGASRPSQSAVVQVAVNKPNPPRSLKVSSMEVNSNGLVSLVLRWKKPENLDVPVHRYRVYWSERLASTEWSEELVNLRVHQARVPGKIYTFEKDDLKPNQTYVFELQAICRWRSKRLRSKLTYITISTPSDKRQKTFDGSQNTKGQGTGVKDPNKKATNKGPSIPVITASNDTSGSTKDVLPGLSSTSRLSAQPGMAVFAILPLMLIVQ